MATRSPRALWEMQRRGRGTPAVQTPIHWGETPRVSSSPEAGVQEASEAADSYTEVSFNERPPEEVCQERC